MRRIMTQNYRERVRAYIDAMRNTRHCTKIIGDMTHKGAAAIAVYARDENTHIIE